MKYQRQGLFLYAYAKYAEYVLSRNYDMQNVIMKMNMQVMVNHMSNDMQIKMHNVHNKQTSIYKTCTQKICRWICRKICQKNAEYVSKYVNLYVKHVKYANKYAT
jgi:hypothetical protein